MLIPLVMLIIGLIVLIKSGELSIKYSIQLSKLMGVSELAVGFIILAAVTSLPELSIAIMSGIAGEGIISVSNLLGSNIIDICLIFGVMVLLSAVKTCKEDYKELVRTVAITSVVALLVILLGQINWMFGLFCIGISLLFFYSVWKNNYRLKTKRAEYTGLKTIETIKTMGYTIISITLVIISAKFVTDASIELSIMFGITESLIGATIIAVGTSLPELTLTLSALKRRNFSLALGDIMGSLVTNLTLIMGITALFETIVIDNTTNFIAIFLLLVNMMFLFMTSAMKCSKWQGIIFIGTFFLFLIALVNYQIFFI